MMKNKKKTQTVLLSTLLIGGINYTAYVDAQKNGVPTPSEMEFGQACSGPLFQAKLEANNERYKVANSMPPSGTYSRRRLMDDDSKRSRRRQSLGPDGPDAPKTIATTTTTIPRLGVSESTKKNNAHLAAKEIMFNSEQPFDVTVVINAALWCGGISLLLSIILAVFIVF